jgi:dolichyl-phosphate beta-glucosyltransferase
MSRRIEISLIIPAFNEERRLPRFLAEARAYLQREFPGRYEILVVDDGSRDATAWMARQLLGDAAVILLPHNAGKGAAVRAGMRAARGRLRLFADADGATPISEEARLRKCIEDGASVAIGSRAARGGKLRYTFKEVPTRPAPTGNAIEWHVRPSRHFSGRIYSWFVRTLLGLRQADTQCGFKMFTADAADEIFSHAVFDRFAFDAELLLIAGRLGLSVVEVPVHWHEVHGSKIRMWRDAPQMLLELFRIRRQHRDLKPEALPAARPRRIA